MSTKKGWINVFGEEMLVLPFFFSCNPLTKIWTFQPICMSVYLWSLLISSVSVFFSASVFVSSSQLTFPWLVHVSSLTGPSVSVSLLYRFLFHFLKPTDPVLLTGLWLTFCQKANIPISGPLYGHTHTNTYAFVYPWPTYNHTHAYLHMHMLSHRGFPVYSITPWVP